MFFLSRCCVVWNIMTLDHIIVAHDRCIWYMVNMGSGNGLVPHGTKPLPEPMLTNPKKEIENRSRSVTATSRTWRFDHMKCCSLSVPEKIVYYVWYLSFKMIVRQLWAVYSILGIPILRQNGWNFAGFIFICIFLNENCNILIQISLNIVLKSPWCQ